MARYPLITPEELRRAAEVYAATASYTEAAAAVGRDRIAIMRGLKRASDDNTRTRVYARTLDAVLSEGVTAQREAVKRLRRDARSSDPKVAHSAVAALNDTIRAAGTSRTAHAKLVGDHAPESVKIDADDALVGKLARLVAAAGTGEDPR